MENEISTNRTKIEQLKSEFDCKYAQLQTNLLEINVQRDELLVKRSNLERVVKAKIFQTEGKVITLPPFEQMLQVFFFDIFA